ncbi:MAG: metallophosphoesterase [Planctomycetaceae bacterium]|nr:metallophosphoesterase [Planctomycetaceae bacterium]
MKITLELLSLMILAVFTIFVSAVSEYVITGDTSHLIFGQQPEAVSQTLDEVRSDNNIVVIKKSGLAKSEEIPATSRLPDTVMDKAPQKKLSFAFLTDVHLNKNNSNDRLNGFQQCLERVKKTDASFIVFGGDLVDNSGMGKNNTREECENLFDLFKETVDAAGLKYYPAIGNHDRFFDKESGYVAGDELFKVYFKDSYYTFERQGVHFFVLNSVFSNYAIPKEELDWLKAELEKVPLDAPIVVVTHVPVYSIYYPVTAGKYTSADIIVNNKELLAAFKKHNLKLVLQGHMHLYEEIFSQKVQYITGGAVCANWWNGSFHGTEEGFLFIEVDSENHFTWRYVDYGWQPKTK